VTDLRVLYVAGFGRSGSTLLGNTLGSIDGFFSTGELHLLWVALSQGSGCACGEPVARCLVWAEVLARLATIRGMAPSPEEARSWQLAEARVVHTPRILRLDDRSESGRPTLDRYVTLLGDLYRAISDVTGARVIVDSSKTPSDAALLSRVPGVDPRLLQLVRDPRAVAFSQGRARPTLDAHRQGQMHRRGILESAARWVSVNRLTERLRRRDPQRSDLLRYEDFVAEPRSSITRLATLAGVAEAVLPFVDDRTVRLREHHTVWGNRSRFASGDVTLRSDEAWRTEASGSLLAGTTALTAPWLRRYGYPFRPGSAPVPSGA